MYVSIADRLQQVRQRLERAAVGAGRDPSSVRLVAVSKTFPASAVREAYAAGQRDFGENRVQEALQKIGETADLPIRWHLLGHLQANKARKAGQAFAMVQSVDSVELLQKLDAAAAEAGRTLDLLIQVDLASEATKFGVPPEAALPLFEAGPSCRAARIVGLMTLPPVPDSAGRRAALVQAAARGPRRVGGVGRAGAHAQRAVDGHERRFRGGRRGRRHHRSRRNGDIRSALRKPR